MNERMVSAIIRERSIEHCRNGEEPGVAHPRIALDRKEPGHVPRFHEYRKDWANLEIGPV